MNDQNVLGRCSTGRNLSFLAPLLNLNLDAHLLHIESLHVATVAETLSLLRAQIRNPILYKTVAQPRVISWRINRHLTILFLFVRWDIAVNVREKKYDSAFLWEFH